MVGSAGAALCNEASRFLSLFPLVADFLQVSFVHHRIKRYSRQRSVFILGCAAGAKGQSAAGLSGEVDVMVSGSLMMAWLLLTAGAPASDIVYLNQQAFKVPLDIKPSERSQIRELVLFVSTDQGQTWRQEAVSSPDQDGLKYYAPKDGSYWLTVDVVDQKGNHNPRDIAKAPPSQKVVIDTLRPLLRIASAERKGDEVEVAWEIQEENPDMASLRVEYRPADAPAGIWYNAPLQPALTGRTKFAVHSSEKVAVRIQMQDLASNPGLAETEVPAALGVSTTSLKTGGPAGDPIVGVGDAKTTDPLPMMPAPASVKETTQAVFTSTSSAARPVTEPLVPPVAPAKELSFGKVESATGPAVSNEARGAPAPSLGNVEPKSAPPTLPTLQVVKSKLVTLEYAVPRVGPSGIGKVELWLTEDDGRTWRRYAEDPDEKIPVTENKYQRTLELPGEGVFGLRMVVRSRAGLAKAPPRSGDLPQMRIEVDLTPPAVKLDPPAPHPTRRDALVLTWTASDPNLAPNPITLQWAERPGSWQTIATHLPNTGRHTWQLPPNVPDRVYLRLIARDTAGNEGVAEFTKPQLVDLIEPEGVLLKVVTPAEKP
jgi:hypothetical protein